MSHFPHRWKDLLQYQLLILRTYRQFSGRVWLSYDQAFREIAAATNLTDWSQFNSRLLSFHSAGWSARSSRNFSDRQNEPNGAALSQIICKSWNWGHCVAPSASCRFSHKCASYGPSVLAMAHTGLQSARPTHPPSPARLRSVFPTHRLLGPAANPVVCRLAPPLSFH